MKYNVLVSLVLVIAGIMIAGCTQSQSAAATPTPVPAAITSAAAATAATPQPSFSLGDHYLQKSYSFQSEKDSTPNSSGWTILVGIDINILPLNDNLQYCWFEMTVTNMDSGRNDTYGYGRSVQL